MEYFVNKEIIDNIIRFISIKDIVKLRSISKCFVINLNQKIYIISLNHMNNLLGRKYMINEGLIKFMVPNNENIIYYNDLNVCYSGLGVHIITIDPNFIFHSYEIDSDKTWNSLSESSCSIESSDSFDENYSDMICSHYVYSHINDIKIIVFTIDDWNNKNKNNKLHNALIEYPLKC